jgi:hypothetical protein
MHSSGPLKRKEKCVFNIKIIQINTHHHHIVVVGGDVPPHIYKQNLNCTLSKKIGLINMPVLMVLNTANLSINDNEF